MHTSRHSTCAVSNPHLSFAAGFGTLAFYTRLPGFIGPFPPPLLIRLYAISFNILLIFSKKSTVFSGNYPEKCSQFCYGLFIILLVECYKMLFLGVTCLKNLRRQFEVYCYKNRNKGIPNLMLYISLGTALVYIMSQMSGNYLLYNLLYFDRQLILQGQIWRLFTYPLTYHIENLMLMAVSLFCYYSLGRAMESIWGTLRFNLFYFTGVVLMDIYCMIFGETASVTYLNLSLFLSYATLFPDAQFLLFFIIPVKAWIFALFDLAIVVLDLITLPFPYNLFSVISLANYFLFFGKDVLNVIPLSWRRKFMKGPKKQPAPRPKVIRFESAKTQQKASQANYTHRCTICGRTDVSNPELEFRYCSRCKGYYCYCEEHISNHSHIE